jgi:hypothetical protein
MELVGADEPVEAKPGTVSPAVVFVKVPRKNLTEEQEKITFRVEATHAGGNPVKAQRVSVFIGPRR